ncbi:peroxide stress protein YaaA [Brachybacterium sillae]|uniref:peroxide stress protein YaaA n=1 Tax=Brachybacterium sillae TaxID=2810536 RepID=UPI00217DFEA5|nr:peroxide stress protein YaaA [Brachybacterium sillae]
MLFDALGEATATDDRQVLITSALLGVVAAGDRIPAYRLSAGSDLHRLGQVGPWWRPHLAPLGAQISASGRLVVDARSGAYRSMMPVAGAIRVDAVVERGGRRQVVSHDAKRYRGLLGRALLTAETAPTTPTQLRQLAADLLGPGLEAELDGQVLVLVDRRD